MTIQEACDLLKGELLDNGYEYGFYLDGVKYRPDPALGFDAGFQRDLLTDYRIQNPSDTQREKIGTCNDVALLMKTLLASRGVPGKIWLLDYARGKKFHTILTFQAENQVIYLELTPQSRKPWYGKELLYASEAQLISEYRKTDCELTDVTDSVRAGSTPEFILSRIG